jgi:hypothetical protein
MNPIVAFAFATAGWFILLGVMHLLTWVFGVQFMFARNRWGVLLVCSELTALLYWTFFTDPGAVGAPTNWAHVGLAATAPWVIYAYCRLRKWAYRHRHEQRTAARTGMTAKPDDLAPLP